MTHCYLIALVALSIATGGCNRHQPAEKVVVDDSSRELPSFAAPPSVATDQFLILQVRPSQFEHSEIVQRMRECFANVTLAGFSWERIDHMTERELFGKSAQIDTVTFCYPHVPDDDHRESEYVMIVVWKDAIPKDDVRRRKQPAQRPGFLRIDDEILMGFPDDKTMVVLHEKLADRYLAGYAKSKEGWPLNKEFLDAARESVFFGVANPSQIPNEVKRSRDWQPYSGLLEVRSITASVNVTGMELRVGVRCAFTNDAQVQKGNETTTRLVRELAREVSKVADDPFNKEDYSALMKVIAKATAALNEARLESTGTDLIATAAFNADFNMSEIKQAADERVREEAKRTARQQNLKKIGSAVQSFTAAHQEMLPIWGIDGKGASVRGWNAVPHLSWRVAILPYIDAELYKQFKLDEPWDSEHNRKLINKMPKVFAPIDGTKNPMGRTYYQQVIGLGAMWPGLSTKHIEDGTANTVAVIEAAVPVVWTKPDDVFFEPQFVREPPPNLKQHFGGVFPNGFNVLMCDGSVLWIDSRRITHQTLWYAITPAGGETGVLP